jgi:hypothetical protein
VVNIEMNKNLGGDKMTGENDQPISEKQGYPRNEEFNPRKGEDYYGFQFNNRKQAEDNAMANAQAATANATIALNGAVAFQQKMNDMSLSWMDAREKAQNANIAMRSGISESEQTQRLEHEDEHDLHQRDNDRKTLTELYGSITPEEAAGMVPVLQALVNMLKKEK